MDKVIYLVKINKLEELFVAKGLKDSASSTPSKTAERFCINFCYDHDADYDTDDIVIFVDEGYVSYSDLDYLDENGIEYEDYEWVDLRFQKKNNSVWY